MKDLKHYFGQSPKEDDSPSSVKENDLTSEVKPVANCLNEVNNVKVLKQNLSNPSCEDPSIDEDVYAGSKTPKSSKSKRSKSSSQKALKARGKPNKKCNEELSSKSNESGKNVQEWKESTTQLQNSVTNGILKSKSPKNAKITTTVKPCNEHNPLITTESYSLISNGDNDRESEQQQCTQSIIHFFSPKRKSCSEGSIRTSAEIRSVDLEGTAANSKSCLEKPKEVACNDEVIMKKAKRKVNSTSRGAQLKSKLSITKRYEVTSPCESTSDPQTNDITKQTSAILSKHKPPRERAVKSAKKKLTLSKGKCEVVQNGDESDLSSDVCVVGNKKTDGSSRLHVHVNNTIKCMMSKDVKSESCKALNRITLEKACVPCTKTNNPPEKLDSNPMTGKQCSDLFINQKKCGKTKKNILQSDSNYSSMALVDPKIIVDNEIDEKPQDCLLMGDAEPNEMLSPKTDDSRRNSLMKYFQKVSKEEALAKTEKVELKVEVMVHSPPTTPSKKERRRYVNSNRKSLSTEFKKSKLVKNKSKTNIDAIHVIGVEEINPSDAQSVSHIGKVDVFSHQELQPETSTAKSLSLKKSSKKTKAASAKSCPAGTPSLPDTNPLFRESPKEMSSTRKKAYPLKSAKYSGKIETKSKNVCLEEEGSPSKCSKVVEMSPEVIPEKTDEKKTPNQSWKLRVCLTPHGLPYTRGTMQEEVSDCEEIFFTPNTKKRRIVKDTISKVANSKSFKGRSIPEQGDNKTDSPDIIFDLEKPLDESKTGTKLAPLFVLKEKANARQEFLLSGVPDQVKKMVEAHEMFEEQDAAVFPLISHIQQKTEENVWRLSNVELPLKPDVLEESFEVSSALCKPGLLSECFGESEELNKILSVSCEGPRSHVRKGFSTSVIKPILRLIRKECPDFKVVNTFTALREKVRQERQAAAAAERVAATAALAAAQKARRRSSSARQPQSSKETDGMHPAFRSQVWTEKYKPISASEIIGNEDCVLQLKRWLEAWRKVSEEARKQPCKEETRKVRQRRKKDDYDDDFFVPDDSSDEDRGNLPVNPALLYGQSGSGKTCSVYALANDYGFKVLEVNASEKRNGKIILSKLSEATQSHQVQRSNSAEQGFAALFGVKAPQPSAPKNKKPKLEVMDISEDKEDDKAEKMSLILIDDVDIVFEEEDEGFISALVNLISTSKRPVILTTTDPESPYIARFFNNSSLILYFSPSRENLCTWLQLVCLLEGVYAAPAAVKSLVALCEGDIRRALLQMQVWVTTGGNNLAIPHLPVSLPASSSRKRKKGGDQCEIDVVDDQSCISLEESSTCPDNAVPLIPPNPDCIGALLGRNDETRSSEDSNLYSRTSHLITSYPLNTGLFWWNLAPMLGLPQISHQPLPVVKECPQPSGPGKLLNDSFFATFCSDEENSNEPISNENCTRGDSEDSLKPHVGEIVFEKPDLTEEKCMSYSSSCTQDEMTAVMRQMGSLSTIDIISTCTHLPETIDCDEPVSRLWQKPAKNSLLLSKPVVMGPNYTLESTARGLIHWLAEQTLSETRLCLKSAKEEEPFFDAYDPCLPSFDERRWRLIHADCEQAIDAAIPLCVQLDRRAVATDYISTIQTMSRLEHNRSIANTKRRNRFYHYLKGMGLHLTDMQLEFFCQSMSRTS